MKRFGLLCQAARDRSTGLMAGGRRRPGVLPLVDLARVGTQALRMERAALSRQPRHLAMGAFHPESDCLLDFSHCRRLKSRNWKSLDP